MDTFELETKVQALLLVVEALAFLVLAVWCLDRRREGSWAWLGAVGAALVGIVLALLAAPAVAVLFFDRYDFGWWAYGNPHAGTVYVVARVVGVLLLVTAFVRSRRRPPAPDGSIYGP